MVNNKKISELTYLSSGSIVSSSMVEIVQAGENYRTTPKDFVQFAIPIDINALPTGSDPVITTASNLGSGEGIYGQKVGNDLQFKSLVAGNNITLSSSSVGITVNAASSTGSAVIFKNFTLNEDMNQGDLAVIMSNGNVRKIQYSVFGDEYIYNEAVTDSNNIIAVDSNKIVIIYRDSASTDFMAKVGFVDGSSFTFGSASILSTGSSTAFYITSGAALDSTRFAVTYHPPDRKSGLLKIGTIEGTSITFGSASVFVTGTSATSGIHCGALDSSKVVVVYKDPNLSSYAYAKVGVITGTNVTYGSASIIINEDAPVTSLSVLSATSFVVSYRKTASSYEGDLKIGTVSGTDITFGSATTYDTATSTTSREDSLTTLNSLKFVISYADNSHDDRGTSKVGIITGTTATLGTAVTFTTSAINTTQYTGFRTRTLTDTKFVAIFNNNGSGSVRTAVVDNASISYSTAYSFGVSGGHLTASSLDTTSFVIGYNDNANNDYGTVVFSTGDPSVITDRISGILQMSGSVGQSKPVAVFGETSNIHIGLVPGRLYYYNTTSRSGVTSVLNNYLAGIALSSSELKIVSY